MPTYEYRCKSCGHELEVVQAFTDDALTRCESCGADALRKVFGSVGISFKGSGFYKNDSRGKSSSTAAASGSDKGSSDAGSPTKDGGSSSTPASTPAPTPSASTSSTSASD